MTACSSEYPPNFLISFKLQNIFLLYFLFLSLISCFKHTLVSQTVAMVCFIYIFTAVNDVSFSLFSPAQRPLSGLYLPAACSFWLASSCAQAEFSPTTPIMKIKTCGRGPNRYCRLLHTVKHTQTNRGCKIAQTQ